MSWLGGLAVLALPALLGGQARPLWTDVTSTALPPTKYWTNKVEIADLDGDGRMNVVQGQGEHPKAFTETVHRGTGLAKDTAPPSVTRVHVVPAAVPGPARVRVRARVHDRKSPSLATDWRRVDVEWTTAAGPRRVPMCWYGEYLWTADWPRDIPGATPYRVCATDAAGNDACASPVP